jgi:NSS family neurotransmitter:Na+ symporter
MGGLVWPLLIGLILSSIIMVWIIYRGPERISKVVLWTVPLPIILIIILMVRGLTLPGAMEGLEFYLTPDFGALSRPQVWVQAYSQVFFSLSLAMGAMMVYASHKPRNSDVTGNAFIVSLADCGVSFLCGLTIFSILGYMAHTTGVAVPDVVSSGIGLAFITIPTAIELLPALSTLFGVVFFLALLTLAIDSAFSLIEVNTAAFMDKWGITRRKATLMVSTIAFAMGLLYSTNGGMYWLDIVDHFINNFGLAAVGLVEVLLIGWFFGTQRFKGFINPISDIKAGRWWDIMIKFVTPAVLGYSLIRYFIDEVGVAYGDYPLKFLLIGGWGVALLVVVAAIAVSKLKSHKGRKDVG